MKTITTREYELFSLFFKWFKERTDTDLSLDFVEFLEEEVGIMDITAIIDIVCGTLGETVMDVMSKSKKEELVDCRCIISRILKDRGQTLKSIGLTMGGRDHSTIHNQLNNHEDWMFSEKAYRNKYEKVLNVMIK